MVSGCGPSPRRSGFGPAGGCQGVGDDPMTTESCKAKLMAMHNLSRVRVYLRLIFFLVILIVFALWMDYWISGELGMAKKFVEVLQSQWGWRVLIAGGIIYILLLSLPFVPGVELGVLLMCSFGKEGIVFVYLATIAGLCLAFWIGRLVPKNWVRVGLEKIGLSRFDMIQSDGIEKIADHLHTGRKFFPARLWPFLVKYRYLAIAVSINLPGNYILGGGGGISLACGTSRSVSWKWFLLTIVLAVSPVPLLAYLGILQLEVFFGV